MATRKPANLPPPAEEEDFDRARAFVAVDWMIARGPAAANVGHGGAGTTEARS